VEIRDAARRALQSNTAPEATEPLRAALGKATDNVWKIGLINALGYRKDAGSTQAFVAALNSSDPLLTMAGAKALGNVGGDAAIAALTAALKAPGTMRPIVLDAYFRCAERLVAEKKNDQAYALYQAMYVPAESLPVRLGALRGMAAASPVRAQPLVTAALKSAESPVRGLAVDLLNENTTPDGMKLILAQLPGVGPDVQAQLLGLVATNGDASARPVVLPLAASDDDAIRIAALGALGKVGNAADVAVLAKAASGRAAVVAAARLGLTRLSGPDINPAMVAALKSGDANVKTLLINALADRKANIAQDAIIANLTDASFSVSAAAVDALRFIGDDKALASLVSLYVKTDPAQRQPIEQGIIRIAARTTDADAKCAAIFATIPAPAAQPALLRLAGQIGGDKLIANLHQARTSTDAAVQDAAVRALAESPDIKVAPELLDIAKTTKNDTHKVLALRGYIRLGDTLAAQPAEQLTMYKQAMDLAGPAEKRTALAGVGGMRSPDALALAVATLADADVREQAGLAVVSISRGMTSGAGGRGRRGGNAASVGTIRAALQKVLDSAPSDRVKADAQSVLQGIQ
jgi:HEAT repeat protein